MGQFWQAFLWILASFSLPFAIAGVAYTLVKPQQSLQFLSGNQNSNSSGLTCQTIIADPKPPLNVRSSPVVAPDNKIASLPNGTPLTIVDENEGWLRIASPLQGWVYKELTVTSCVSLADVAQAKVAAPVNPAKDDSGTQLMAIATEQFQSGHLSGAIALAKTVPLQSRAYQSAQLAILQWQHDWNRAESDYYTAQKALRDGRWQDVLKRVNGYPNIRYWKEKMAPLVQSAIEKRR
ncbi:MAG: SH3 domain-containing protein [Oscillatoriales cyanobacterium C42_A2020_001]|nr:SH3 domain-containing protein [Leptolyngbyaceae cyanobacterium C42_A2020_001]